MFDLRTVTCTWPDAVDCKFGEEFAATIDKKGGGSDDGDGGGEEESQFCPWRYTGRGPTKNCGGYVQCNAGKEGILANCPPDSRFNAATSLCEHGPFPSPLGRPSTRPSISV